MLKRLFSIITISLILTGSFFNAYSSINHVYADDTTDEWTQVTTNEQLVEAFRYYCKSRDLTIEGSVADAVTSFTTKTFNGLCNTLGIDMTALQAQIKYQTDGNLGTRFLFSTLSIDAYNRIFAQFLQDNDLEVGDKVEDQLIHSGIYYTGYDNYTSELYIFSRSWSGYDDNNYCTHVGSNYKYTYDDLKSRISGSVRIRSYYTFDFTYDNRYSLGGLDGYCLGYKMKRNGSSYTTFYVPEVGSTCGIILYRNAGDSDNIIRCAVYWVSTYNGNPRYSLNEFDNFVTNSPVTSTNIYITTNNTVINNNNYEGDTIINNNGDTNVYPDTPDIPDPNPGPTPDPPTIPDSGGWQDFSLPDMPNDWLIYGMEKKFPFDIPFNILFALSLLNHEPEIPKFEGDIDLQVCTWHYDIDLTPFDDIATILRKFEVLGFIIGLAILTKNLINWG